MSNNILGKGSFEADTKDDGSDKGNNVGVELLEEHAHLSLGDVLKGTAVHESTSFERKAALINE